MKALRTILRNARRWFEWFGDAVLRALGGRSRGQALLVVLGLDALLVGLALLLPASREDPSHHFREFRLITFLSVLQLLTVAALSWQVYLERSRDRAGRNAFRVEPRHLWFLIAGGFVFLAVDELFQIHEITDKLIHLVGQIEETALTDRIDDLIVALYGLAALGVLFYFRREILAFPRSWLLFALAFLFLGLTIALDFKLIEALLPPATDEDLQTLVLRWRSVGEEVSKLTSECFFIAALYGCVLDARRMRA